MKIELFVLCDFAQDNNGKFTIVGCYDTILSEKFPGNHTMSYIALKLRLNNDEAGKHKFSIIIKSKSGNNIIPRIDGEINVTKDTKQSSFPINLPLLISNIKFNEPDTCEVILEFDGIEVSSIPLFIKKRT